jgi:hypothetical protein
MSPGRPKAWQPTLRILEHALGPTKETVEVEDPTAKPLEQLGHRELMALLRQRVAEGEKDPARLTDQRPCTGGVRFVHAIDRE